MTSSDPRMARTHDPERVLSVVDTEPGLGLVPEDPSDSLAETLLPGESDDYADEDDPTRVGRYMIIEKVGAGGMGAVYAAFDPELDRKVAVKLLHLRHCGSETQLRLIREAQAMARLSHPNVVAVHDVGTYQHRVFMAMDFVEGATLHRWLRERTRSWREVLDLMLQAGRGLAAAHAAGLLHRDFKPDNVLVGDDGRAQVTDFGLACAVNKPAGRRRELTITGEMASASLSGAGVLDSRSLSGMLASDLTQDGALLGTPAYMAPEQFVGRATDERSDLFSFCVALYEGLYGYRPFAGETLFDITTAITKNKVRAPPPGTRVPAWIRRIVLRGLRMRPDERWPSMTALLAALARDPWRKLRRGLTVTVATLAVAGSSYAIADSRAAKARQCVSAQGLDGIWDDAARADGAEAFDALKLPYARDTWTRVAGLLDAYAASWLEIRRAACDAHQASAYTDRMFEQATACLEQRRAELSALVDVYRSPDPAVVELAVEAASELTPVERCVDSNVLTAAVLPPGDAATVARVDELRHALARARADHVAGRFNAAEAEAREVLEEARTLGYRPLLAEALVRLGAVLKDDSRYEDAVAALSEALESATASSHDEVATTAAILLTDTVGNRMIELKAAAAYEAVARGMIERTGQTGGPIHADLLHVFGRIRLEEADYAGARERLERALVIQRKILPRNHPATARTLASLGTLAKRQGELEDALAHYEEAAAIYTAALGPAHPQVAKTEGSIAATLRSLGKLDEAQARYEAALAALERSVGRGHESYAVLLNNLGNLHLVNRGDRAAARREYERALAIYREVHGDRHPKVAKAHINLGAVALKERDHERAEEHFQEALRINTAARGEGHPLNAVILFNLANNAHTQGRLEEARTLGLRALAVQEATSERGSLELLPFLIELTQIEAKLGDCDAALERGQRQVALALDHDASPVALADARAYFADALWICKRDRPRALALFRESESIFAAAGEAEKLEQLRANWRGRDARG